MTPTEVNVPRHVALYRDICQHPEDDTRRLAYADLLDEIGDERVPCPKCKGEKTVPYCSRFMCSCAELNVECDCGSLESCDKCDGDGTVLAHPDAHDRALLIRYHCGETEDPGSWRAPELLRLHPEWSRCPCPECRGEGSHSGPLGAGRCGVCFGTGDLFSTHWRPEEAVLPGHKPRTVAFARGFPDSVECTAADVWREGPCPEKGCEGGTIGRPKKGAVGGQWLGRMCDRCDGTGRATVPTEWAKAVVRETPVTRFVATDLAPRHVSDVLGKGWTWPRRMTLPDPVRDLLASTGGVQQPAFNSGYVRWETEQLCRDALAVALGKWVRVAAYPAASVG